MSESNIGVWPVKRLGDILRLEYGKGLGADDRTGSGYPVFGSSGQVGLHSAPLVAGPGIVVGRKGTVGAVTWSEESFWPIDTTYYVQWEQSNPVDRRWTFWQLSALPLRRLDSSTGVPGLNRQDAYAMVVQFPSLGEQRRIAEILDTVDDAIRSTDRLITKMELMKQGLLHDLLAVGISDSGRLRDPVSERGMFRVLNGLKLPTGWDICDLNSVVDPHRPVVYGILMPGYGFAGGVPVVKVKDMRDGRINEEGLLLTDPRIDNEYRRSRVIEGDLLFSIRGTVGRRAFVPASLDGANITQDTARLAIKGANARFVSHYLGAHSAATFIELHTLGQAVKGINLRDVRRIPLVLPPRREQDAITEILDAHDAQVQMEKQSCAELRFLKAGLMEDLLTGRIRVNLGWSAA